MDGMEGQVACKTLTTLYTTRSKPSNRYLCFDQHSVQCHQLPNPNAAVHVHDTSKVAEFAQGADGRTGGLALQRWRQICVYLGCSYIPS